MAYFGIWIRLQTAYNDTDEFEITISLNYDLVNLALNEHNWEIMDSLTGFSAAWNHTNY